MKRPAALDLFCCGGAAGHGLLSAGFQTVIGIDIDDHKQSYEHAPGMHFIQLDARTLTAADLQCFDFLWASPPCQLFCSIVPQAMRDAHQARWQREGKHLDLIPSTRELFIQSKKPYIIENVESARASLVNPIRLCGTMFDLATFRHRLFESNLAISAPCKCHHTNCSVGALNMSSRLAAKERYVGSCELPDGVECVEKIFPCRRAEHVDRIYHARSEAMQTLFIEHYGRKYARSIKEVHRATGVLQAIPEHERRQLRPDPSLPPGHKQMYPIYGDNPGRGSTNEWRAALGAPWLTRYECRQAIPPAYSEHLARQALRHIRQPAPT